MAVLAKSDNVLVGLSTDVKPTNFIPGSVFYETDTGKKFEWRGGAWVELDTMAAAIGEPVANPAANTLLARIKALEDKIDDITAGTTPAKVEGEVTLSGSNVEQTNGEDIAIKSNLVAGKSPTGKQIPLKVSEDGDLVLTGATITVVDKDLRGLAVNKPLASAVDVGTTYWSVDTDPNADAVEVSDGTSWTVMV